MKTLTPANLLGVYIAELSVAYGDGDTWLIFYHYQRETAFVTSCLLGYTWSP